MMNWKDVLISTSHTFGKLQSVDLGVSFNARMISLDSFLRMSYLLEIRLIQEHPSIQHEHHKPSKDFWGFFLSMFLGNKKTQWTLYFSSSYNFMLLSWWFIKFLFSHSIPSMFSTGFYCFIGAKTLVVKAQNRAPNLIKLTTKALSVCLSFQLQ